MSWSGYEGRSLETWWLDSFLGERDHKAFYVGRNAAGGESLLIQLIAAEGHECVSESWRRAGELSHQHLLRVHASGESELGGIRVAYAVLDLPDDDLSEVLSKRALDPREARSTRAAIASVLDYLHQHGLQHGAVAPSNIFLERGEWKLGVDTISPAQDGGREQDLQQLDAILGAAPAATPTAQPAPTPRGRFGWLVPLAASVAIVLFTAYLLLHRQVSLTPVTERAETVPPRAPAAEEARPAFAARGDRNRATRRPAPWAVIAATYASFDAAEKRATQIRKRAPRLEPHVFPRAGQSKLYFVVLGSGLNRDEAERLRRTALALGAPRDTYVTKLDES